MESIVGTAVALQGAEDPWGNPYRPGQEVPAEVKGRELKMSYGMFYTPIDDPCWKFFPRGEDTPLETLKKKYSFHIDENWAYSLLLSHRHLFEGGQVKACPIDEGDRGFAIEFALVKGETPADWTFFRTDEKVCLWAPSQGGYDSDGFMETTLWGT